MKTNTKYVQSILARPHMKSSRFTNKGIANGLQALRKLREFSNGFNGSAVASFVDEASVNVPDAGFKRIGSQMTELEDLLFYARLAVQDLEAEVNARKIVIIKDELGLFKKAK